MRDIDVIIQNLTSAYPALQARQLKVVNPGADDDGLWLFRISGKVIEVQLESTSGMCPFLFESSGNNSRNNANTIASAVELVAAGLGLLGTAA
jgi:hypothetical protein